MLRCVSHSCGGHDWSASVSHVIFNFQEVLDVSQSGLSIKPSSGVFRLLLSPGPGGVFIVLCLSDDLLEWEWAKRLNSHDGNVIFVILGSLSFEIKVHLPSAENYFSNFFWSDQAWILVFDEQLEPGTFSKIFNI